MSAGKYNWGGDSLPNLDKHSLCKHAIIKNYLSDYIRTRFPISLGFSKDPTLRLTIVDGFAGGGLYEYGGVEKPGSPLIIAHAVTDARKLLAEKYGENSVNFNVDIICIEKNKKSVAHLTHVLKEFEYLHGKILVWNGEFVELLPDAIRFIQQKGNKNSKCLFILDQCGYTDVPMPQLRQILNMKNSEVILTFAIDFLIRFFSEKSEATLQKIGLDVPCMEILKSLEDNPENSRAKIQQILSSNIQQHISAPFYTPFLIHSDRSHLGYWLLHFSQHFKARDVMMEIHWEYGRRLAHHGKPGLDDMLAYHPSLDTGQQAISDEYRFDLDAKNRSMAVLPKELVNALRQAPAPLTYAQLKQSIPNGTPANADMIKSALWTLRDVCELRIPRREGKNIQDKDVLQLPPQKSIFLFGNTD